jgi:hypothetical protein
MFSAVAAQAAFQRAAAGPWRPGGICSFLTPLSALAEIVLNL